MVTLGCNFEEFKKRAKEFIDAAPTLNMEELDGAWSCLSLSYIGMDEEMWAHSAKILHEMCAKVYVDRCIKIDSGKL